MGLVVSCPEGVTPPPERIAERGRSGPRAGSRREAGAAACRCRRSGTTRRPASERKRRSRYRYPTQRTSREDPPCRRRGSRTRMRNMAVHVAHDRRARADADAGHHARSALHASLPRRHLPRLPHTAWPRPRPHTPSIQPRTTGSAGSAPAARRRGIGASTTWMRNHAGNDRMGRRSAATARSGDTTAAAYRRRGDDDMAET